MFIFKKYIYKVQRRPVCVIVSFLYRITGCKYFSDLGTDERWTLLEAQLGCSGSVYPGCPADADLQGGIEQPEDDTNSYGSCDGHSCRTRPQPDRWPPRPPGSSRLLSQWARSYLAPVSHGLCCCRPQWDFPPACHSHWSWSSSQNRR